MWITAIVAVMEIIFTVVMGTVVWHVRAMSERIERLKEQKEAATTQLEADLSKTVRELVKAQFEKETSGLRSSVDLLNGTITRCVERLDDGDDDFKDFVQKSIEQRIEQMTLVAEMSGKMTERLAKLSAEVSLLMSERDVRRQG